MGDNVALRGIIPLHFSAGTIIWYANGMLNAFVCICSTCALMRKAIPLIFFCYFLCQYSLGGKLSGDGGACGAFDTTILITGGIGQTDTAIHRGSRKVSMLDDTTGFDMLFIRGSCKETICVMHLYPMKYASKKSVQPLLMKKLAARQNRIRGDVMYDYSKHASPDTSFPGSSFVQQQAVVNVYAPLMHKYPVIFHAGVLQTNVPYINNYIDVSVQFDRKSYGSSMLNHLQDQAMKQETEDERKDSLLYAASVNRFDNGQALSTWLNGDKEVQQLIGSNNLLKQYQPSSPNDSSVTNALGEVRQLIPMLPSPAIGQALSASSPTRDSSAGAIPADSVQKAVGFIQEYADKLMAWQKSGKEQDSLEHQFDSSRNALQARKDSVDKLVNSGNIAQLQKLYPDSSKGAHNYDWLMGIRQLSLGRSMANYTELSAKNISLMGINAEYCHHYYFALAAGKIDFRYLDFLMATPTPNQYLFLGRVGIGEPEHKHLYFTVYTGSKEASYVNTNNVPAVNKLTGITLEAKVPVDRNTYLTGEIAKSSYPDYIATGSTPGKLLGFSDRANEAYSLQLFSYLPATDTRIYGMYDKMGVYFQSFNIFNNNASTTSWQARLDQYIWKKRLSLNASVKKNDFSTPFIVNNYKSKSVFYSLQVSLRLRKWPVFTAGFLPYSQLTSINGQLVENRFYTLMGSSNYAYRVKGIFMSSSLVYTHYFNSSNQTGFLFYDAQSWFLNHSVMLKQFTLTASGTITQSPSYYLLSAGPGIQWKVNHSLSIGAGAKYNDLNNVNKPMGYNGNVVWQVGHLGRINLSYERGYIPGQNNSLFRNNWGRATYFKNF